VGSIPFCESCKLCAHSGSLVRAGLRENGAIDVPYWRYRRGRSNGRVKRAEWSAKAEGAGAKIRYPTFPLRTNILGQVDTNLAGISSTTVRVLFLRPCIRLCVCSWNSLLKQTSPLTTLTTLQTSTSHEYKFMVRSAHHGHPY
jgi:hypothetical protein